MKEKLLSNFFSMYFSYIRYDSNLNIDPIHPLSDKSSMNIKWVLFEKAKFVKRPEGFKIKLSLSVL